MAENIDKSGKNDKVDKSVKSVKSNEKKGGGAKYGLAALLLLLIGGVGGFGLGNGGLGLGGSPQGGASQEQTPAQEESEAQADPAEETEPETAQEQEQDQQEEAVPDTIIVTIHEKDVTINGHAVQNAEELRAYVEKYHNDSRTYVLEEDHAILETYNWVKGVFDDMESALKNSK